MSLNKFTDVTFGRDLGLRIGCSELETGVLTCDSIDAQNQFLDESIYTSLSDEQGQGLGPHPLLPAGEGSLTIPVNTLRTGSVFKVSCKGILSCPAGATLTFRLQGTTLASGTFDMLVMTVAKVTDSTIRNFSIDFDVACRLGGTQGVANYKAFGEGYIRVDGSLNPEMITGQADVADFGTDEAVTLQLLASSDSVTLNIVSMIAEVKI